MPKPKDGAVTTLDKIGLETMAAMLNNNTLTAAAESLSISRQALYERIEKYNLREVVESIPRQAVSTLMHGSVKAADNLVNKIDSKDDDTSIKASTEVLDRIGLTKPQQKSDININFNQHVTEQRAKYEL